MAETCRIMMIILAGLVEKLDRFSLLCYIFCLVLVIEFLVEFVEVLDLVLGVMKTPSFENVRRYCGDLIQLVEQKVFELKCLLDGDLFSGVYDD